VTRIAAETTDPAGAGSVAATPEPSADGDRFELRVELGATYDSLAQHGRALASLLLVIHGWLDDQEARSVEVTVDDRNFTLRKRDRDS
jgi:hypothetical protein